MKYIQDTFSERDKNILLLRIWDDMSYDEIAQITGESVSNSKKIVSRSLAKIGANISFSALFIFFISHVITR
jgi:DNA-directed RNA polymerase specialized sigma24 family protein